MPGWVWPVVAVAVGIMVLVGGLLAVPWATVLAKAGLSAEERLMRERLALQGRLSEILEGVNDASSASAAATELDGPYSERVEELVDRLLALRPKYEALSDDQKRVYDDLAMKIEQKYAAEIEAADQRKRDALVRLSSLPAEIRQPVVDALRRLADRGREIRFKLQGEDHEKAWERSRHRLEEGRRETERMIEEHRRWADEAAREHRERIDRLRNRAPGGSSPPRPLGGPAAPAGGEF